MQGDPTERMIDVFRAKNYPIIEYNNEHMRFGKQQFMKVHGHEYEKQLYQNERIVVVSCSMLDNRTQLADIFGINRSDIKITPDSSLIGAAYHKWGKDAPKYLDGMFAFAIYDKITNSIFLARDHTGNISMYYCSDASNLYFASTLRQINYIHRKFREIDNEVLLHCLTTRPLFPINNDDIHKTIFRNVYKLPPGSIAMSVSSTDGTNKWRVEKYYELLDNIKPLKLNSDKEYEEAFIANISSVVTSAMHGYTNFASQMSSGFDSATVNCILANELKGISALRAFCYSPNNPEVLISPKGNYLLDEYPLAHEIALYNGNIKLVKVSQGEGNIWTSLDKSLNDYNSSFFHHANYGWVSNIMAQCKQANVDILTSATMGNLVLSSGRFNNALIQMKNQGEYHKIFFTLFRHISQNITDVRHIRAVLSSIIKSYIYNGRQHPSLHIESLFKESARKKEHVDNIYNLLANGMTAFISGLFSSFVNNPTAIDMSLWAAYGIVSRDVTRNRRAFEFILSIPSEQHAKIYLDRSLVRRSIKHILPQNKISSHARGLQGGDWMLLLGTDWHFFLSYAETVLEEPFVRNIVDTNKAITFIQTKKSLDKFDYNSPFVNDIVRLVKLHRYLQILENTPQ